MMVWEACAENPCCRTTTGALIVLTTADPQLEERLIRSARERWAPSPWWVSMQTSIQLLTCLSNREVHQHRKCRAHGIAK